LQRLGPGFPVERLVGFEVNPGLNGYTRDQAIAYFQRLSENLRAIPGVQSVGLAVIRILQGDEWDSGLTVEGYSAVKPGAYPQAYMNKISPNYFATLGVPIVAGRDFTPQDNRRIKGADDDESATVAIINESFARQFFPRQNPIGRHIGFGTDLGTKTTMEIIGVVKDIKYTDLREDIPVQVFLPYLASGFTGQSQMTVYLRTTGDPAPVMRAAREKVHELDAGVPIYRMRTTEEQVSNSLSSERMIASLSAVFGFLATLLATIGLYGVMAYAVARRTREIGIRMALGAEKGNVIWMVMREVLVLVGVGVAAGVPAAYAIARISGHWISGMLFGLSATDPVIIALAAFSMASVALLAGFFPARRASQVDPIVALRYE
jgi:predicted permease